MAGKSVAALGREADELFRKLGLDPNFGSLAAFEAATFAPLQFMDLMHARRIQVGISQEDVAKLVGCTAPSLGRWEAGYSPRIVTATAWANALGLDLSLGLQGQVPRAGQGSQGRALTRAGQGRLPGQ